jgi:hypothetical protein
MAGSPTVGFIRHLAGRSRIWCRRRVLQHPSAHERRSTTCGKSFPNLDITSRNQLGHVHAERLTPF